MMICALTEAKIAAAAMSLDEKDMVVVIMVLYNDKCANECDKN